MTSRPSRLVVLDRDGVVNVDSGAFIKSVAEWQPIPGSLEAIAALTSGGFRVAVITNQSGVGRGLFTEETLVAIHARMSEAVRSTGGELAGVYYCPHHPDAGCECRKPKTALLRRLERDLACSLAGVPFIGDRLSDIEAADAVEARAILVRTGTGATTERLLRGRPLEVFDDLQAASRALLAELE